MSINATTAENLFEVADLSVVESVAEKELNPIEILTYSANYFLLQGLQYRLSIEHEQSERNALSYLITKVDDELFENLKGSSRIDTKASILLETMDHQRDGFLQMFLEMIGDNALDLPITYEGIRLYREEIQKWLEIDFEKNSVLWPYTRSEYKKRLKRSASNKQNSFSPKGKYPFSIGTSLFLISSFLLSSCVGQGIDDCIATGENLGLKSSSDALDSLLMFSNEGYSVSCPDATEASIGACTVYSGESCDGDINGHLSDGNIMENNSTVQLGVERLLELSSNPADFDKVLPKIYWVDLKAIPVFCSNGASGCMWDGNNQTEILKLILPSSGLSCNNVVAAMEEILHGLDTVTDTNYEAINFVPLENTNLYLRYGYVGDKIDSLQINYFYKSIDDDTFEVSSYLFENMLEIFIKDYIAWVMEDLVLNSSFQYLGESALLADGTIGSFYNKETLDRFRMVSSENREIFLRKYQEHYIKKEYLEIMQLWGSMFYPEMSQIDQISKWNENFYSSKLSYFFDYYGDDLQEKKFVIPDSSLLLESEILSQKMLEQLAIKE